MNQYFKTLYFNSNDMLLEIRSIASAIDISENQLLIYFLQKGMNQDCDIRITQKLKLLNGKTAQVRGNHKK